MKASPVYRFLPFLLLVLTAVAGVPAQQISIPRIDLMPDRPSPYIMRDWKSVARGYDSLVFNLNLSGTYLPLSWINNSTVNYPSHPTFGLNTVVGTTASGSAEAINCLPACIGAALSGIDKSSQGGKNWVLMSEEWFNRRPEQNVYKNHWVDDLSDDWWYETMPNIFFYQLNALYPGTGDFNYQFTTVADRWLQSIQAMGGKTTPWSIPSMDHRGWYLQTMTPYDAGVHEPEASGAIAWICYSAYAVTGNEKYRIGAEQAMEFLNLQTSNPSYELQLSYGTYVAARMNAELGTSYSTQKLVNWCFNVGPLRSWGATVGNWGGLDCSGLIGEVNGSNDYAFAMNTFEQVGALVPMVRYDQRYARAIGKWALNAANASRLFYPKYLPANHQDSYAWASQYDSNSVIAHEAMRQFNGGTTPYATGDAISGGWGSTTLTLYGSSHVGILGGIIDTTNVPMILKLDLLKTDYYHAPAWPSYLLFNPYDSSSSVTFDAGAGTHDLYDIVSKTMLQTGISGNVALTIPAGTAVVIVVLPAGGTVTYQLDKMLVNGVVADYHSGHAPPNLPPRIKALAPDRGTLLFGDTISVWCTAVDPDNDTVAFLWRASSGILTGGGSHVSLIAPDTSETIHLRCIVNDGHGNSDTASVDIAVVPAIEHPPVINLLTASPRKLFLGGVSRLHASASDPDGDSLSFVWTSAGGTVLGGDSIVDWTLPPVSGDYKAFCSVGDGRGGIDTDSIAVEVRDTTLQQSGHLILHLPFTGNAADVSGNLHNGTVHAAVLAPDRFGSPNSAYSFNGTNAWISVANSPDLNFQQGITVSFWMKAAAFAAHEEHPVSHGSWQNRWKVSIGNQHLRWTVKTASGTKDLDSPTLLQPNRFYHVAVCYDGSEVELYLDGLLDAFAPWTGLVNTTTIDFTIGQVLPTDANYNYNGVLDDVRIYDYALSASTVAALASDITGIDGDGKPLFPVTTSLGRNYPNPFNPSTQIDFEMSQRGDVTLRIFDLLGREAASLIHQTLSPGYYSVKWNAAGMPSGVYFVRFETTNIRQIRKILLLR